MFIHNIYSIIVLMRFLFRIPRHQQFQIKPRYYDPIKEEIKERTERIKQRMEDSGEEDYQPTRIEFKRKTRSASSTSILQLGIATALGGIDPRMAVSRKRSFLLRSLDCASIVSFFPNQKLPQT